MGGRGEDGDTREGRIKGLDRRGRDKRGDGRPEGEELTLKEKWKGRGLGNRGGNRVGQGVTQIPNSGKEEVGEKGETRRGEQEGRLAW